MMEAGKATGLTFEHEDSLPSLPLPSLKQSLENYLASVKPLVSGDEYEETVRVVGNFQETIGPELQAKLQQRADSNRNWLEVWWEKYAYLQSRLPVAVLNGASAMDGVNMSNWPPRAGTQVERASQGIWIACSYFLRLRREEETVDTDPNGDPYSMHQLRSLFCSCREPAEGCDRMMRYFKTEREGPCPSHVVVFCSGHIYRMEVFHQDGTLYGSKEIMRHLMNIKMRSASWRGQCIGALTATARDEWAKAYNHMCSLSESNQRIFEIIRSAMFGVCLDSDSPMNISEALRAGNCGINVQDRWFDKGYMQIFFESGMFIYTSDHTGFDGFPAFKQALHYQEVFANAPLGYMGSQETYGSRPMPEELIFVTDDLVEEYKQRALVTFKENAPKLDILGTHIDCGRRLIKKNGISPDAFMQMAIQLAYMSQNNRPAPCYETGATVMFYHGRTDTIRTCSQEMVDFCEAMRDNSKTKSEKMRLMRSVHAKHRELTVQAVTGQAFDRHLLGLYITALETGMEPPEIFLDPSYVKSGGGGNYILSTSQLGRFYQFGALAPMREDGYSVFYNIMEERMYATVTSYTTCPHTDSMEFLELIHHSVMAMKSLLKEAAKL